MGVAEIIPGISGGTIAFILGIFEDLVQSIRSADLECLRLLIRFKIKDAINHISWRFILAVASGSVAAILSLSHLISWLLVNKPVFIHAFFFGLILATIPIIVRIIPTWNMMKASLVVFVSILVYYLTQFSPATTPETLWFVFLSGAICICAWIMPGISGAFILVILGKYHYILDAVNTRDFVIIGVFLAGISFGIVIFVRILNWLLEKFHDLTILVLTGVVIGSMSKIWPWKENISLMTTSKGKIIALEQINFLPDQLNAEVYLAIALMIIGCSIAVLISGSSQANLNE